MHFRALRRPGYRNVMTTDSVAAAVESIRTARAPEILTGCGVAKTGD